MAQATLVLEVEYDEAKTDPEALATAFDALLETALSTPGILEEYGDPKAGPIYVGQPKENHPCRRRP